MRYLKHLSKEDIEKYVTKNNIDFISLFETHITPYVLKDPHMVYSAITNIDWFHVYFNLKVNKWYRSVHDKYGILYSFRSAGGIISDIRNEILNTNENYMDYYCQSLEGQVDEEFGNYMKEKGWFWR